MQLTASMPLIAFAQIKGANLGSRSLAAADGRSFSRRVTDGYVVCPQGEGAHA